MISLREEGPLDDLLLCRGRLAWYATLTEASLGALVYSFALRFLIPAALLIYRNKISPFPTAKLGTNLTPSTTTL